MRSESHDAGALAALSLLARGEHPSSGLFPTPIRRRGLPRTISEVDQARAAKKANKKDKARKKNKAARRARRRSL